MRAGIFALLFIAAGTGLTVYNHYQVHGALNAVYIAVAFFLVLNLLICYWEICLFIQAQHISESTARYHEQFPDARSQPAIDFLMDKLRFKDIFSTHYWSRVWSTYAIFDGSYADRRTFGFNADIGNGMFTLIPSLLVHIGYTYHFLEANVIGIISLCLFYQMTYMTFLYWVSFLQVGRHKLNSKMENLIYILGTNAPWFIFGCVGIYASIRLILDNNYSVFGL